MVTEVFDDSTALSLLKAVWQDSPSAWERLLRQYTPFVYRYCRLAGLSPHESADVGQEVFEAVYRKISIFRRDEQEHTFRGWLHTITRNKIVDHFRRQRRQPTVGLAHVEHLLTTALPDDDALEPNPEGLFRPALANVVRCVRNEFEQSSWRAFWETTVEGRMAADVADEVGISVNAVYLARSRILRRLREAIQGTFD